MKFGAWNVSSFDTGEVRELEQAGYGPLCARVLSARGCGDEASAADYLRRDTPLNSPFLMKDMKAAADRVRLAVARKEHIAVFGDYDVDGITSTALMTDFLRSLGARVTSYIPARLEEGYGLNEIAIRQLSRRQVNLIVTVDCGITANEEAELCRRLGIDLVVTDHHECKPELPRAVAVVDPHRPDCTYPHTGLSGVGIAFQLASAICGDQEGLLDRYADLLCLGLVADVMPLHGEVRTMVVRGMQALEHPTRPGVAALMEEIGCAGDPVTTATVGYLLAPRINAAGRMGRVETALRLFLTEDPAEAQSLAAVLCRLNRDRQKVEAGIYEEASAMLGPDAQPAAIVLAGETWHQGVVGIVASRLAEDYGCPVFLVCMSGDVGKASSRSYGGFPLFSTLEKLSGLLENFGGHELAAGFSIRRDNIDEFRRQVSVLAAAWRDEHPEGKALELDCAVSPALLTVQNVSALDRLEPFGAGFSRPQFYMDDLRVEQLTEVGGGKHLRLRLSRDGELLSGIFFSTTACQAGIVQGDMVEAAFIPQVNEFRGTRSVQLNLVDIRPCSAWRQAMDRDRAVYSRYCKGTLTCGEAVTLIPPRQEFAAVWRYLSANARDGMLTDDPELLARKIARSADLPCSFVRTRVCLDVLEERGLIHLEAGSRTVSIRLTPGPGKVDLQRSAILIRLRKEGDV